MPDIPDEKDENSLDRIQRQLYARDESAEIAKRQKDIQRFDIKRKRLPTSAGVDIFDKESVSFKNVEEEQTRRRRKVIILVIVGVLLVSIAAMALAGTLWYRKRQAVKDEQVKLEVVAPASFTSGEEIAYKIRYGNESHVDWNNVEVLFQPPPGFSLVRSSQEAVPNGQNYLASLGILESGSSGEVEVVGTLIGERDTSFVAKAEISFTPENFPSGRFNSSSLATTVVTAVPLVVAVDMAPEVIRGEKTVANISITNTSTQTIENGYVQLQPVDGIQFVTEDPEFGAGFSVLDQGWGLPPLKPLEVLSKRAVITVQAHPGEKRVLEVSVGVRQGEKTVVQSSLSATVTVAATELSVEQQYNDARNTLAVIAGQEVRGVIKYSNTGSIGLKDVVIKTVFEGEGIDPSTLKLESGSYDSRSRTITWTSASLPQLAILQPQQSGEIVYTFKIKNTASFPSGKESKNHALIINTSADSPDVSLRRAEASKAVSDRFVISVASDLTLEAGAFYDDGRIGMPSSGPIPPRVGEETVYTLRLRAGSTLNDIGNIRIVGILPDGVRTTGKTVKTVGDVSFNERSGEFQWVIPTLSGQSGVATMPAELQVQIGVTPSENQRAQVISLLKSLTGSAMDMFTDSQLSSTFENLPTTDTAVPNNGKVE